MLDGGEQVDGEEGGGAAGAVGEAGVVPGVPGVDHAVEGRARPQLYPHEPLRSDVIRG